jgi:hypothetical protein
LPGSELNSRLPQPLQPGAQQDGGLLSAREDAFARPNIGLDRQLLRPSPQRVRAKLSQQIAPPLRLRAITSRKVLHRLAVSQVQTAAPGDQKFAARGRLGVANNDTRSGGCRHFRCAQAGRTGTDHGY